MLICAVLGLVVHENSDVSVVALACLSDLTSPAMSQPPLEQEEQGLAALVQAIAVRHKTHSLSHREAEGGAGGARRLTD